MIAREAKRIQTVNNKRAVREDLRNRSLSVELTYEERLESRNKLQKMPRNSSPSRIQRRCRQCGRSRAVYRKFALCRLCLRESLMNGEVAGGRKASW